MPHNRKPSEPSRIAPRSGHAQLRSAEGALRIAASPAPLRGGASASGGSAVAIDRVVAAGVNAVETLQRHLVARIVAEVHDRLHEYGFAEWIDSNAARFDPPLELIRSLQRIGAGLTAGHDLALAGAVQNPACVGDQLVVWQGQQR